MNGDLELTSFINSYRGPLIGLIASWGAPWADAAEIAQDSFAEAWIKRDSCRGDWRDLEVFGRWLRGVAYNRYRNWARSRRRHQWRTSAFADEDFQHPASRSTEDHGSLRQAIDRLPAKQKEVVLMHYLEETGVKEVAALLSVPAKTVEGRLYQARRALHRMLSGDAVSAGAKRLLCL